MRRLVRHLALWFVGPAETPFASGAESCDYLRRLRAVPGQSVAETLDRAA